MTTDKSWIGLKMATLCKLDNVYWCNGGDEEYDRLAAELVENGTIKRLNDDLRPWLYVCPDPAMLQGLKTRTFICSEKKEDAGPNQ